MDDGRICTWCTRTSQRKTRVSCARARENGRPCGAQWDLELRDNCPVCLSFAYTRVPPTAGDLPGLYADLVLLTEDLLKVEASDAHRDLARTVAELRANFVRAYGTEPAA